MKTSKILAKILLFFLVSSNFYGDERKTHINIKICLWDSRKFLHLQILASIEM